jgi:hypothetical protein
MTGAMRKVMTEETIKKIQKLKKEEGLSAVVIGQRFGLSASGIIWALKNHAKREAEKEKNETFTRLPDLRGLQLPQEENSLIP